MYPKNDPFSYASDYYLVVPRGVEKKHAVGEGTLIIKDEYCIYFKPNTPEDIKERFVKEYDLYYRQMKERGVYF